MSKQVRELNLRELEEKIKKEKEEIKKEILYFTLNTFSVPYRLEYLIRILELRGKYLMLEELEDYLGIEEEIDYDSLPF